MPPSNIMMRCLSVASISAATPARNHYLNFSLMINSGFALIQHIISNFSTTKQNNVCVSQQKIKYTMERKLLCLICLLFTVAKYSLEHLQTLAVILFLIFQKYKAVKNLQPKGHNIYLPWAASTADDAAFPFVLIEFDRQLNQEMGNHTFRQNFFPILILLCNLTRIHSQIISQSN